MYYYANNIFYKMKRKNLTLTAYIVLMLNRRFLIYSFHVTLQNPSSLSLLLCLIQGLQKRNLLFLKMKSTEC